MNADLAGGYGMTVARRLARFVVRSSYEDLSEGARQQTKIRILDSIGCALGVLSDKKLEDIAESVENLEYTSAKDFMNALAATF